MSDASLRAIEFRTEHQPTFQEMDPYGHLNTLHYVDYYLVHRFTGMRELMGLDMKAIEALPFGFFTTKLALEFLRPVACDQKIEIRSRITEHDAASCRVDAEMRDARGRTLSRCVMHFACVDKATGRAGKWPPEFMARFFDAKGTLE